MNAGLRKGAALGLLAPNEGPRIAVAPIRGDAYDFFETDCRSTRRSFFGVHPALNDTDLGFQGVPVMGL